MRHPIVRWPVGALCLFIAYLGLSQGLQTLQSGSDWSEDYVRADAEIVASEEVLDSTASGRASYTCRPVISWEHADSTYLDTPIWLGRTTSYTRVGEDCAEDRYGEIVPIWIDIGGPEPVALQPGNRSAQPMSALLNLGQGALFLAIGGVVLLPRRRPASKK